MLSAVFGVIGLLPGDASGGLYRLVKLFALIALAVVLIALFIYIARRRFDTSMGGRRRGVRSGE